MSKHREARVELRAMIEARGHTPHTTQTYQCPHCLGGYSQERSLAVTLNPAGALFFCHRASCDFKGFLPAGYAVSQPPAKPKAALPRPLTMPTEPVSGEWSSYFAHLPGLVYGASPLTRTPSVHELAALGRLTALTYDPTVLVTELRGVDGQALGHLTRQRHPDGTKTVRTWRAGAEPLYNFWRGTSKTLLIVEDSVSAYCLWEAGRWLRIRGQLGEQDVPSSLALLGTNASDALVDVIKRLSPARIFVMLDPGAEEAAVRLARRLQSGGLDAGPYFIGSDIKDTDFTSVYRLVRAVATV